MYQDTVYATNDDCRRYQKGNNPDALKELDAYVLSPSYQEILEQIDLINSKLELLTTSKEH